MGGNVLTFPFLFSEQEYGQASGRTWNFDLCDVNPLYVEDVCNCTAAAELYKSSHPTISKFFPFFFSFSYILLWLTFILQLVTLLPII
jgi:hypothetical protein